MTALLYECRIVHARRAPLRNAFSYRTYQWLVDLDELPPPRGWLRLLAGFRLGAAQPHAGADALCHWVEPERPVSVLIPVSDG